VVKAIGPGLCGIVVGAPTVARAISILDGLARAAEKLDLKLEGSGDAMSVRSGGDTIKLALKEQVEWRKYVPSANELAAEAKRKAREDRDRLRGIWAYGQGRAYPEQYQFRTSRLSFELENRYIHGLRRSWRDGKVQVLENLIDDVAVGVHAYLEGLRAEREERARRERRWAYEATLRWLQQARRQRDEKRHAFVEKYERIGAELHQLQAFISAMRMLRSTGEDDEFSRMMAWTEARCRRLERQVTIDGIASELRAQELFPSVDPLVDPPPPVD
jgi:hypothetical protein